VSRITNQPDTEYKASEHRHAVKRGLAELGISQRKVGNAKLNLKRAVQIQMGQEEISRKVKDEGWQVTRTLDLVDGDGSVRKTSAPIGERLRAHIVQMKPKGRVME
jgi:hypothetical protein